MSKPVPSIDLWLKEAKAHESAPLCGMYLTHNGTGIAAGHGVPASGI